MNDITRVDCSTFWRLDDNMVVDVGHLQLEFDLEYCGQARRTGPPDVIHGPGNETLFRLPDNPVIVRPADQNPCVRDPSWIDLERQ
jgi:hypothetical protein